MPLGAELIVLLEPPPPLHLRREPRWWIRKKSAKNRKREEHGSPPVYRNQLVDSPRSLSSGNWFSRSSPPTINFQRNFPESTKADIAPLHIPRFARPITCADHRNYTGSIKGQLHTTVSNRLRTVIRARGLEKKTIFSPASENKSKRGGEKEASPKLDGQACLNITDRSIR